MAIYLPRREALEETKLADTLNSDVQTSWLWENKFWLFKPLSLWDIVMAALTDWPRVSFKSSEAGV